MGEESVAVRMRPVAELRHDLRTPLNHIIGYGEMLMEDAEDRSDEASVAALRQIHTTAKELVGVIQSVLSPSKTEVTQDELTALRDRLQEPLQGIVSSAGNLLEAGDGSSTKDLETTRPAAERPMSMAGETAPAPPPSPQTAAGTPS